MKERRVLIIGIDGGTWRVLDRAVDSGHMPFLEKLLKTGQRAILNSTMPAITPAAWTAFQTGLPPASSGIYDFRRWNRDGSKAQLVSSRDLPTTIWEIAGSGGKRVGVLNLPMTFPPFAVNGFMISGFMMPSMDAEWAYPPELKGDLLKAVPDYEIVERVVLACQEGKKDLSKFLEHMCSLLRQRAAAAGYLIDRFDADLFMVHFHATDFVQHAAWCYIDPDHPLYEPEKNKAIFRRFYGQLDEAIKRVVEAFESRNRLPYSLFLVSDHGFQTHLRDFNIGNWLVRNRYLSIRKRAFGRGAAKALLRLVHRLDVFKVRRLGTPKRVRQSLGHFTFTPQKERVNMRRSAAYPIGAGVHTFLFLNVRNNKCRARARKLLDELRELRDPDTDEKVVKAIHSTGVSEGDPLYNVFPDFVIEAEAGYGIKSRNRKSEAIFEGVDFDSEYQLGKHARDGIFLAVNANREFPGELGIENMAEIVLSELGLEHKKETVRKRRRTAYSDSDAEVVGRRLSELGYC